MMLSLIFYYFFLVDQFNHDYFFLCGDTLKSSDETLSGVRYVSLWEITVQMKDAFMRVEFFGKDVIVEV